jgi:hypothetical protein
MYLNYSGKMISREEPGKNKNTFVKEDISILGRPLGSERRFTP